jgi:hypothetical protein
MRRTCSIALVVAVPVGALALALPAAATPPVHSSGYIDSTRTFAAGTLCSFAVVRHMYGTESETVQTLHDGTVRDRFYVQDFTYTLSNPAAGKTVSSKEGGQFTIFEYADGSVQVVITGNDALFTSPHSGFIAGQNGRYVETDYPDGSATVDTATGHFDTGFDQALCDTLT